METESLQSFHLEEQKRLARTDRRKDTPFPLTSAGRGPDEHLRFEGLWFEDGNVIVVAGKARFKLYRGILTQYSSVFKDVFQMADAAASGSVEGCPLVHITDNPTEVVLFS